MLYSMNNITDQVILVSNTETREKQLTSIICPVPRAAMSGNMSALVIRYPEDVHMRLIQSVFISSECVDHNSQTKQRPY